MMNHVKANLHIISFSFRFFENDLNKSFQIVPMFAPSKEHILHAIHYEFLRGDVQQMHMMLIV